MPDNNEDLSVRGQALSYVKRNNLKVGEGGFFVDADLLDTHLLVEAVEYHMAHTEELEAENGRWLTAGELRSYLAQFPDDMPITASNPNGDWFNLIGASNPNETGESSIILVTKDDFDTRQW